MSTFLQGNNTMSASEEYTEEEKKRVFADYVNFFRKKQEEAGKAKKGFDDAYRKWKTTRQETVTKIGTIAESIKQRSDVMTPFQTVSKVLSIAGKIVTLANPAAVATGAATALVGDIGYSTFSAVKVVELERTCNEVKIILERDTEDTQRLFRLSNEIRSISEAVAECVKTFHSATLKGFFSGLPRFLPFVAAIETIKHVDNSDGIMKFLRVLWEEAKSVVTEDTMLIMSFSSLTTYNPGVMELVVTIPQIMLNCGILYSATKSSRDEPASSMSRGLRRLNIFAICADFEDIIRKLIQFNEYPKLSKDLLEIKQKLQDESDKINELAVEMERKVANARNQ